MEPKRAIPIDSMAKQTNHLREKEVKSSNIAVTDRGSTDNGATSAGRGNPTELHLLTTKTSLKSETKLSSACTERERATVEVESAWENISRRNHLGIVAIPLTRTGQRWINVGNQTIRAATGVDGPRETFDLFAKDARTFLPWLQQETMTFELDARRLSDLRFEKNGFKASRNWNLATRDL